MKVLRVLGVLFVVLLLLVWLSPSGFEIEDDSVLVLDVSGTYVESTDPPLLARLAGDASVPFATLLSNLNKAERDARLAAVVLRIRSVGIGWAKAQELRAAIERVSAAGRRTVAYLELEAFSGNLELYIASAADEVVASPASTAPLIGLAGEYLFLGGFFEELGVDFDVARIGRYKTAADTLSGKSMSDAHREMADALLDSIDAQFVAGIAEGRSLTPAQVRAAIDAAPFDAASLEALGIIDRTSHFDGLWDDLGDPTRVDADVYAAVDPASVGFVPQATFALVYGTGNVVTGDGRTTSTGEIVLASDTVSRALIDAAEDPEISAILFRIDSPGGSALASDVIWRATQRVRESGKPLIATFSDVAASGGYYVAAGADAIVASPGSITGSIGVFVLRPVLARTFEKLQIGVESLTRGTHAGIQVSSQPLSPETRARLREEVESIYGLFLSRVADGRPLDENQVDAVAQGRVWTGAQAAEAGLVDELGGMREALLLAKEKAGLPADADVALVPYPPPQPFAEQLGEVLRQVSVSAVGDTPWSRWQRRLQPWIDAANEGRAVALLPFWFEVR
ncbi:MAG: S49 family peptidase [Myxococcota bacterium]